MDSKLAASSGSILRYYYHGDPQDMCFLIILILRPSSLLTVHVVWRGEARLGAELRYMHCMPAGQGPGL